MSAGEIHVRQATEEDLPAILARTNEEIATGFSHFGTEPIAIEGLADQFRRESGRFPWLVARDGRGVFLGFAKAGPWKARGAYAWTVEIGVYVDTGARGRGVGRALYESLLPMLREAGFRTVVAGVALPNEASVRLHESIGMKPAGVLPQVGYKFGAWRDVGYWVVHWNDE